MYAIQRVYTNKGKQDEEEAAPGSGKPKCAPVCRAPFSESCRPGAGLVILRKHALCPGMLAISSPAPSTARCLDSAAAPSAASLTGPVCCRQSLMASLHQKFSGHSTTDGASTKQSQNLEGIDPETSDSDLNPTTGEGADFKYKLVPVAAPGEEQK